MRAKGKTQQSATCHRRGNRSTINFCHWKLTLKFLTRLRVTINGFIGSSSESYPLLSPLLPGEVRFLVRERQSTHLYRLKLILDSVNHSENYQARVLFFIVSPLYFPGISFSKLSVPMWTSEQLSKCTTSDQLCLFRVYCERVASPVMYHFALLPIFPALLIVFLTFAPWGTLCFR